MRRRARIKRKLPHSLELTEEVAEDLNAIAIPSKISENNNQTLETKSVQKSVDKVVANTKFSFPSEVLVMTCRIVSRP